MRGRLLYKPSVVPSGRALPPCPEHDLEQRRCCLTGLNQLSLLRLYFRGHPNVLENCEFPPRVGEASPWKSILNKFQLWSQRSVRWCSAAKETLPGLRISLGAPLANYGVLENTKMSPVFAHVLGIRKSYLSSKLKSFDAHLDTIFYWEEKHCLKFTNDLVERTSKISCF